MATVQAADQFSAIPAEPFADVPRVRKLGYDALGGNVVARAAFDGNVGADYSERFDEVARQFMAFETRS